MLPSHVVSRRIARPARPADPGRDGTGARGRERGAVLVHAAVAMMGLLAFSALSIDLGTLWVSRAQAQNAADAAALSGGVALAYGNTSDYDAALASARAIAQEHTIWGEAIPAETLQMTAGPCPTGSPAMIGDCINVAVQRGSGIGTPLPVFFSRLFGAGATNLRASASAKVMLGNATSCPRPIAIPDRWIENGGTWTYNSIFQRYRPGMPGVLLPNPDRYVPSSASSPGSGYLVNESVGRRIVIDRGHIDAPEVRADDFYSLDLPRPGGTVPGSEEQYDENMTGCSGSTLSIGDTVFTMGAHQNQTQAAIATIIARDPEAVWDGSKVINSAFGVSPRIIQMVLYDPDLFSQVPAPAPELYRAQMVVRNIVGFFVEGMEGGQITGVLVAVPGNNNTGAQSLTQDASFIRSVALVR